MPIESDGHSKGNPRLYELIENAPSPRPGDVAPVMTS
jgi:hypothetical protein